MAPATVGAQPWARNASGTLVLLLILLIPAACADPPVDLPPSSPFPYNVQLGMSFQDLRLARPGIWLEPDSGWVLEEHTRGQYQYELTGDHWPPARGSTLIYVHRIDEELSGDYAAERWETLADSMAVDLSAEPGCATLAHGRLFWRRAMFREPGGQLEAAVELQITTIGDAGPGSATLTTRIWLAEYAAPVARFLEAPQATAGGRLPDWAPCEEPAAMPRDR
ncbi:MAG: hypothetical protein OXI76_00540 [Gemmatimonadota bacterium]|nr:hypothetical protein [Gemmatimonadota bacterium]